MPPAPRNIKVDLRSVQKIHRRDRECARGDAEEVHLGTVEIDDLTVRRLHVIEEKPSASRESDAG